MHNPQHTTTRRRRSATAVVVAALLVAAWAIAAAPAQAHGETVDAVVEAFARGGGEVGVVDYGIRLVFEDGDPVAGADVAVSANGGAIQQAEPTVESVPGTYIATLALQATGTYDVTLTFDGADSEGSVMFVQTIRDPAPGAPIVVVDTADPSRVGTVVLEHSSVLGPKQAAPSDVPADLDHSIIVEAFVASATDPLLIEYAVQVRATDGSPAPPAGATLAAASDTGATVDPVQLAFDGAVHRVTVRYPEPALWNVGISIASDLGLDEITFGENLPWPHYTTEAGQPKVKFDSDEPERAGELPPPEEAVYFAAQPQQATTSTAPAAAAPPSPPTSSAATTGAAPVAPPPVVAAPVSAPVVVQPGAAGQLTRDVVFRIVHLLTLALWLIPIGADAVGRRWRRGPFVAIVGVVGVATTGLALALYGAPVTYPGLFRWSELASRAYGPSYEAAFLLKMAGVLIAVVATVAWARTRRRTPVWVVAAGVVVAVVGVTMMSQFHLFSHL